VLKCATSLWNADLANLGAEIRRVEPYTERFHIDVIDGHKYPILLFFPDLVKAARKHTTLPFEIHLMTTDPMRWVEPFCDAGADRLLVGFGDVEIEQWIAELRKRKKAAGVAMQIHQPLSLIDPYLDRIDMLTIFGTQVGIKGVDMDPSTPRRIREARDLIDSRKLKVEIEVDGGIRRHTVPLMHAAGADYIVPGSLMFGEDPATMRQWLASL